MYDAVNLFAGSLVAILVFGIICLALAIAGWIVTAFKVKKVADFCAIPNTWQAWLPFGGVQQMLLCQSLDAITAGTIPPIVYQIFGYGSIAVLGGMIPFIGALITPLGGICALVIMILTIIQIATHAAQLNYSPVGPILCVILVPFFGTAIAASMLHKSLEQSYS